MPGGSIEVSKEAFDREKNYKPGGYGVAPTGSKAFLHLLEAKCLIASKKKVKVDKHTMVDDKPADPPDELMPHGNEKMTRVANEAVTINIDE